MQTLADFHETLAAMLASAHVKHAGRPKPGEEGYLNQESQDAVTVWRRTAHLAHGYANGESVLGRRPTWEALWGDGMNRSRFLALLDQRSRFNRCEPDGDAALVDDSVTNWEWGLAREVMSTHSLMGAVPGWSRSAETIRRIELDHEVTVQFAVAYTGISLTDMRRAVTECEGREVPVPTGHGEGRVYPDHPVYNLIRANRPKV